MRTQFPKTALPTTGALLLSMVSIAIVERAFGPLAPFIQDELGLNSLQVAIAGDAVLIGSLIGVLPISSLVDRTNTRWAVFGTMFVLSLALIGVTAQFQFAGFFAALVLTGVARSGTVPAINTASARIFSSETRGLAMGVILAGAPLGGLTAGLALPMVASWVGWKGGYGVLAGISSVACVAAWTFLPASRPKAALMEGDRFSWRNFKTNRTIFRLSISYAVIAMPLYASNVFLTLFLVEGFGLSPLLAGGGYALAQISAVAGRLAWGAASDRWFAHRRTQVMSLICLLSAVAFSLLTVLTQQHPGTMIVFTLILVGSSVFASWGVVSIVLVDMVGTEATGTATAILLLFTWGGGLIGPVLFGAIIHATETYALAFGVMAALSTIGGVLFWKLFQ